MKKLTYFIFLIIVLIVVYFIYITNNFKNKLTTSQDVGYSTFYYIFHPTIYPKFYSDYLFNKYEYSKLLAFQKDSPIPYKTIIAAYSYDKNMVLDEATMYKERIDRLEDDLVCIGLSHDRVKQYQSTFKYHTEGSYLVKKYKKLDYESLLNYCKEKENKFNY